MDSFFQRLINRHRDERDSVLRKMQIAIMRHPLRKKEHQLFDVNIKLGPEDKEDKGLIQFAPAMRLAIHIGKYISLNSRDCLKDGVMDLTKLTRRLIALLVEAFGDEVLPKSKSEQDSE
jgi:hypothetical protein